jgi:hypothetical protein
MRMRPQTWSRGGEQCVGVKREIDRMSTTCKCVSSVVTVGMVVGVVVIVVVAAAAVAAALVWWWWWL